MPFCPFAIDVIYLSVNLKGISVSEVPIFFLRSDYNEQSKYYGRIVTTTTHSSRTGVHIELTDIAPEAEESVELLKQNFTLIQESVVIRATEN